MTTDNQTFPPSHKASINSLRGEIGADFEREVFSKPAPATLLKGFIGSKIQRLIQQHQITSQLNLSGTIFGLYHGEEENALGEIQGFASEGATGKKQAHQAAWFVCRLDDMPARDPYSVSKGGDFIPHPEIVIATGRGGMLEFKNWQADHNEWFIIDTPFRCFLESCGYAIGDFQGETLATKPQGFDKITRRVMLDSTALLWDDGAKDFDFASKDPVLKAVKRSERFLQLSHDYGLGAQEFLYNERLTAHEEAAFMTGYPTEQGA